MFMKSFTRFCGTHKTHAAWVLGTVVSILSILSLLGLLPWATQASVNKLEHGITTRLERIEDKIDTFLLERRTP